MAHLQPTDFFFFKPSFTNYIRFARLSCPSRLPRPCSSSPPGRPDGSSDSVKFECLKAPGSSSRASATLRRWDLRTPRRRCRPGTAPSAHRTGAHPTHPPRTTQHRPSASATGAARNAPPAIGQTLYSAISAYRAVRALIGSERRGRRGLLKGRCRIGAPPLGPSAGPSPRGG